jgi:transposase
MNFDEAVDFCKNNPEVAALIILEIEKIKQELSEANEEIRRLNDIIYKDSSNSSKPPSSDNKLNKKVNRKAGGKNSRGAKRGHKGSNLKMVSNPARVEVLEHKECIYCKNDLGSVSAIDTQKRQVYDLPEIKMEVTQYEQHTKLCPCCNSINRPEFPLNLNSYVQYGESVKSFIAYLNTYQMIPYGRIGEIIEDITDHKISSGTIYNILEDYSNRLKPYEDMIKEDIKKEPVIHCDETGVNVKGRLVWMHTVSTTLRTYYLLHAKRGKDAMDDMNILPGYQGVSVHDHWSPYNKYQCMHSFCNAHHLRELNFIMENEKALWAKDMHSLLTKMNIEVHKAKDSDKSSLPASKLRYFSTYYDDICRSALNYYPPPDNPKKTRGRIKQSKGKNLLDRFIKYKNEILRFATNFNIPFTNNLAERDLRMIKVKEKISGCFASFKGGEIFARIKGYISTIKKNGRPVLQELRNVLNGKAYVPGRVGC